VNIWCQYKRGKVTRVTKRGALEQQINYYENELGIAKGHKKQLPKGYVEQVHAKITSLKKELKKEQS
jgi:hypothetical protein